MGRPLRPIAFRGRDAAESEGAAPAAVRKLQHKFILVSMAAVSIVLAIMLAAINVGNYLNVVSEADRRIDLIEENGGSIPQPSAAGTQNGGGRDARGQSPTRMPGAAAGPGMSAETPFETRFFTVTVNASGRALRADTERIAAVDGDEARALAAKLASTNATQGFDGSYRYRAVEADDGSTMYIFLDASRDLASFRNFLVTSAGVGAAGWLAVCVLVVIMSRAAVAPVAESYARQKRFITDASHEIKTPLAVIESANDVIEIEGGESEWTHSIREQVERLTKLTARLVMLARMDEGTSFHMEDISLSDTVAHAAEPYRAVARAHGPALSCDIEEGVRAKGDAAALAQVVELLLDNAMRYASADSTVALSLRAAGRRRVLAVENDCDQMPQGDLDRLFERFYRDDASRNSKTGGSGVGLSVVRAVAEAHRGSARAEAQGPHRIRFTVELGQ